MFASDGNLGKSEQHVEYHHLLDLGSPAGMSFVE